ncbi:hypothetical protein [Caldimonas tepidiphila]|uniref:hypothetical protein n=1 Tax=Caldimonas tepidiphila TaxID=2315841 RepID=UPI000E5A313E|nr:hypothetical protein [Caldimonas tepidiphila]
MNKATRIVSSLTVAALVAGVSTFASLAPPRQPQASPTAREPQHEEHEQWVDEIVRNLCMQGCHFEQLLLSRQ